MKAEAAAVFGLLPKLPSAAKLTQSFDDVLVGPQKDGQFPSTHSGVKVSSLPASQHRYITDLITAYVGDVPPGIPKPLIATYRSSTRAPTSPTPAAPPTRPGPTSASTARRPGSSSPCRAPTRAPRTITRSTATRSTTTARSRSGPRHLKGDRCPML